MQATSENQALLSLVHLATIFRAISVEYRTIRCMLPYQYLLQESQRTRQSFSRRDFH